MRLFQLLLALTLLMTATATRAEEAGSADHSSVHVVFIIPHAIGPRLDSNAPAARVGDLIVPVELIRPIAVTIDGEFVGHAMVGYQDVKPVFVLPRGAHEFRFTIDGYKASTMKLTALGSGSKQYLVVKMEPNSPNPIDRPDQEDLDKDDRRARD